MTTLHQIARKTRVLAALRAQKDDLEAQGLLSLLFVMSNGDRPLGVGTAKCLCCGDLFDYGERSRELRHMFVDPLPGEMNYCRECGNEKFRDTLCTAPARVYPSGAGGSAKDDDPGQQNAYRAWEDLC